MIQFPKQFNRIITVKSHKWPIYMIMRLFRTFFMSQRWGTYSHLSVASSSNLISWADRVPRRSHILMIRWNWSSNRTEIGVCHLSVNHFESPCNNQESNIFFNMSYLIARWIHLRTSVVHDQSINNRSFRRKSILGYIYWYYPWKLLAVSD